MLVRELSKGERARLARAIQKARLDAGLSQEDLRAEIEVGVATIRRLEAGRTAHPSPWVRQQLRAWRSGLLLPELEAVGL